MLCEETCTKCGHPWRDKDRLRFCNNTGKLICATCCKSCGHYRKNILPNGTHCYYTFEKEYKKYRLLNRPILAPPEKVSAVVPKYEAQKLTGKLFDEFYLQAYLYANISDEALRAAKRIELAAMQKVLLPRILSDPKSKRQYYLFNKIKENENVC